MRMRIIDYSTEHRSSISFTTNISNGAWNMFIIIYDTLILRGQFVIDNSNPRGIIFNESEYSCTVNKNSKTITINGPEKCFAPSVAGFVIFVAR